MEFERRLSSGFVPAVIGARTSTRTPRRAGAAGPTRIGGLAAAKARDMEVRGPPGPPGPGARPRGPGARRFLARHGVAFSVQFNKGLSRSVGPGHLGPLPLLSSLAWTGLCPWPSLHVSLHEVRTRWSL